MEIKFEENYTEKCIKTIEDISIILKSDMPNNIKLGLIKYHIDIAQDPNIKFAQFDSIAMKEYERELNE